MQVTKSPVLFSMAAIAAALSFSSVALAATPAAAPTTNATSVQQEAPAASRDSKRGHKHKKMRHHRQYKSTAIVVPGYGGLNDKTVESLALTDDQKKLVADAQAAQNELRGERRENMNAAVTARAGQLKDGKLDPHAALADRKSIHEKSADARQAVTEKWLAVWDGFSADQKKQVAEHFNSRAEKRAEFMQKHAERMEKRNSKADSTSGAKKADTGS